MSELTLIIISFGIGAAVMGTSILLWHQDRKKAATVRSRTYAMLTAAALLLMYPFGGFLFFSLIEKLLRIF